MWRATFGLPHHDGSPVYNACTQQTSHSAKHVASGPRRIHGVAHDITYAVNPRRYFRVIYRLIFQFGSHMDEREFCLSRVF
ncbi:hypothetical protein RDMS_00010 [Deinococcus sp. RL]|nr:hypothetical protein RDMS_00010 [Deinococcus sp. RL]